MYRLRAWVSIFILLGLFSSLHGQYNENINYLSEKPEINKYSGQVELFGKVFDAGYPLKEGKSSQYGIYQVKNYHLHIQNSKASVLLLDKLNLAEGEYIVLSSETGYYQKWTSNTGQFRLNTGIVQGQKLKISCYLLNERAFSPILEHYVLFHENELGMVIRTHKDYGESNNCNVNVACSIADPVRTESQSTARILLIVEEGMGWCTGSLMNNTQNDGTPYFLTAFHCQDGFTPIYDFWRFDFDYQYATCDGSIDEPLRNSITGCSMVSGRQESDFLLLNLGEQVPLSYKPFYAGWNNSDNAANDLILIHHPNGDVKKVTTYGGLGFVTSNTNTLNWSNGVMTPPHHHWFAAHNEGMFEPGSSGGPAFDEDGRVVGQLHGGSISCQNGSSYFGKLSRSWGDGADAATRLRDWLAPGIPTSSLDGYVPQNQYCVGVTTLTDLNGVGEDGSDLDDYLPFTNCSYSIQLPEEYVIEIDFDFILLDESDTLKIFDGSLNANNLLGSYSGEFSQQITLVSTSNEITVEFVTDEEGENEGFSFQYQGRLKEKRIGGSVESIAGNRMEDVRIRLLNENYQTLDIVNTNNLGQFEFVISDNETLFFLVAAYDELEVSSGISLLDRFQLINFFRSGQAFDNPLSQLAADIDGSKRIDRRDMIYLGMLEDGDISAWPSQVELWRFFNTDQFPYSSEEILDRIFDNEYRMIRVDLSRDPETEWKNYRFFGLKTGDINLSR